MSRANKKIKVGNVHVALFRADISIFVGPHEDMMAWLEKNAEKDAYEKIQQDVEEYPIDKSIDARTYFPKGSGSLIWMPRFSLNELAHETFHAVSHMLRHKPIPLSDDTEEVYAYTYAFVFEALYKFAHK